MVKKLVKKTLTTAKAALIFVFLIGALIISLTGNNVYAQSAITVTFNFDTGTPALSSQPTPFSQTSNGVTATFSSPSDAAAFSVQRYETTFIKLSQFSGNYLYDNKPSRDALDIKFDVPITSITFTFATFEFHGATGEPSVITLQAYMDSTATTPIGSATAHGTWPTGDAYPQGTLSYNSNNQQFNMVRIELLYQGTIAANDFSLDNVLIVTASSPTPTPTPLAPTPAPKIKAKNTSATCATSG